MLTVKLHKEKRIDKLMKIKAIKYDTYELN